MVKDFVLDANTIPFDDLKRGVRDSTYEQCPACLKYLVWRMIPAENIRCDKQREEFWGAPCFYETVSGYTCPSCGEYIDF